MNTWSRGLRMAKKTVVDKAGETVGIGIAMASDVAGAIKTAFDGAVTAMTGVLKKEPAKQAAKKAAKKSVANKASKKAFKKALGKKIAAAKKTVAKRGAKKTEKKPAKKAGRKRR
jgi:hypothetical protein